MSSYTAVIYCCRPIGLVFFLPHKIVGKARCGGDQSYQQYEYWFCNILYLWYCTMTNQVRSLLTECHVSSLNSSKNMSIPRRGRHPTAAAVNMHLHTLNFYVLVMYVYDTAVPCFLFVMRPRHCGSIHRVTTTTNAWTAFGGGYLRELTILEDCSVLRTVRYLVQV